MTIRATLRSARLAVLVALVPGALLAAGPHAASAQAPCVPGTTIPGVCPPPEQPPPSNPPPATGPPGGSTPPPSPPPSQPSGACGIERSSRSDFVGLVAEDVFAGDAGYRACTLTAQAQSGTGLLRQTFHWSQLEYAKGKFDYSIYDSYVGTVAAHGIRILPILFSPPAFHAKRGSRRGTYPPKRAANMARFARVMVNRYGPRGTYWRANPRVPKLPIRAWQIWNEPNLPVYWPPSPSAKRYVALLRTVGRAIKRADRSAEIVTAGLPDSRLGTPLRKYIRQLYRAGAKGAFDTLALNPYATTSAGVLRSVSGVRRIMNRSGDRRAKIWVTELGWSDTGPASPFRVGEDGQARRITQTFAALARRRSRLGVRGLVYYNWRDGAPYEGGKDFWGLHTGLLDQAGRRKKAFEAFGRAARKIR